MLEFNDYLLIEYLENNKDRFIDQQEVCENVDGFTWSDDIRNHCCELWHSVDRINNDPEVPYIIYLKNHSVKISTKEEAEKIINKKMENALKEFKRYWNLVKKANKDNSYYFDLNTGKQKIMEIFKENENDL